MKAGVSEDTYKAVCMALKYRHSILLDRVLEYELALEIQPHVIEALCLKDTE